jgi:hypothetical protein
MGTSRWTPAAGRATTLQTADAPARILTSLWVRKSITPGEEASFIVGQGLGERAPECGKGDEARGGAPRVPGGA